MKKLSKLIFIPLLTLITVLSCSKKENQLVYEGGTEPVLSASTSTITLSFATSTQEAVKLMWTNPNYMFNTGVSSQDVTYHVEIDKGGANFGSSNKQTVVVSKDLSLSLGVGLLNDYLLNQLQLTPAVQSEIEIRVKASLGNRGTELISNTLKYNVTPYAIPPKVNPPATGKLFIVGSATAGGWNNPVPVPSQEFTQISPTLYEITVTLTGGQSYLWLPENGVWAKYGGLGDNNTNDPIEGEFKAEGSDMLAPPATGDYKIEVDFQRGKYKLTKL